MLVGGSLYLLQLAKTYANDETSTGAKGFFNISLIIELLVLLYINNKNTLSQIRKIRMMINSEDLIPRTFIPGLEMKI